MCFSPRISAILFLAALLPAAGCGPSGTKDPAILAQLPDDVDYNIHIKPILSDRCYACHGPDDNARQADLRLYTEEGALHTKLASGRRAITPGSRRKSAVFHRINSDDSDVVMPPPESNLALSEYEKALIGRWIDQGAEWKPHWAFLPPVQPDVPEVTQSFWPHDPLDAFVLARLEREGLAPSPEADKERLLRRVNFDLTGLPPTITEIDAFLADDSPGAYERVVDRLLASPSYGERLAIDWMDVSRYADSHGYHADGIRTMWPWRDWVIEAFNRNVPYDQFVSWQLAGDLLSKATREQKLATAFHRNHPMTAEGGIIDEEYRLEYVIDRANTTAQAFLGMTMECARCHDHKFDPISQKEYYQFTAFFNNVQELGMTGNDGNAGPLLTLLSEEEQAGLAAVRAHIEELEQSLARRRGEVSAAGIYRNTATTTAMLGSGLLDHYPLDTITGKSTPNRVAGSEPAEVQGELELVPGPRGQAARFDDDYDLLHLTAAGLFERTDPFTIGLWIHPEEGGDYTKILGNAFHKDTYWRGWELFLDSLNHVGARLIHAFPHNYIHVRTRAAVELGSWTHLTLTYDGGSRAGGLRIFIDGAKAPLVIEYDKLYKSILPVDGNYERIDRPVRVARSYRAFAGNDGIFRGYMDDIRLYGRALTPGEAAILAGIEVTEEPDAHRLASYLQHTDAPYQHIMRDLQRAREKEQELIADALEVMVMEEMEEPRATYVLGRGQYDQPGERVAPGVPAAFGGFPDSLPPNRLGLAQWLFADDNPLTARVTVNRYWFLLFGQGLVSTPQDFGSQGILPSHPELLDHLATTFVTSGWDVKGLLRKIVLSATYRQSSSASPALLARDPSNDLLARGPRHRLPAELIRDNALAASGLLVSHVGGPSVKPYQPPGLWIEKGNFSSALLTYKPDQGESLYRRSLYTFIRRTSPPPSMAVFDAPDRTTCTVRRQNTNTPLQALVLMNDPQYVEAARLLAERMQKSGASDLHGQLVYGFRLATGRRPAPEEVALLAELYEKEEARFASAPADADSLFSVGDHPADAALDKTVTAALAMVAGLMINHDEAYTKR